MSKSEIGRSRGRLVTAAVALLIVVMLPARVHAAELRNDWAAWYGCWQPVDADTSIIMCVVPGATAASVRMVTVAAGAITEESVLHADGVAHPVAESGCTGHETAKWSSDRRRIFVRTELDCGPVKRTSSSVLGFVNVNEFIDAQAVTVHGQHVGRAIRYRALPIDSVPAVLAGSLSADRRLAAETSRLFSATPLDIDAVIEASAQVAPPAVEALLAAHDSGFQLDGRALVRLESANVPRSVMNVMIALSYPKRFVVQQQADPVDPEVRRRALEQCYDPYFGRWRDGIDCYYYDPYRRYGYRSRYGYGYGGYDYNYGGRGYGPGRWNDPPIIIVTRDDEQRTAGEVVKGQGYTSGTAARTGSARPRSATEPRTSTSGSSGATSAGSSTGSSSTGSSTGSSTSSGSGTSTGRTAVPRGGGGSDTPPPPPPPAEPKPEPKPAPSTSTAGSTAGSTAAQTTSSTPTPAPRTAVPRTGGGGS